MLGESLEVLDPDDLVSLGVGQAVTDHARFQHLVDRALVSLIPNLIEPAVLNRRIFLHLAILASRGEK